MEFLSLLYTVLLVAICLQQALLLYRSGKPAPRQDDEALKEWVRQQLDAQSKLFAQKQAELARQNYDAMRGISETLQTAVQGMSSTLNAGQAAQQQTQEAEQQTAPDQTPPLEEETQRQTHLLHLRAADIRRGQSHSGRHIVREE